MTMRERIEQAIKEELELLEWHEAAARPDLHAAITTRVLDAMREPTERMIEASNREWDGRMSHRSSGAWQAMIAAAKEGA